MSFLKLRKLKEGKGRQFIKWVKCVSAKEPIKMESASYKFRLKFKHLMKVNIMFVLGRHLGSWVVADGY